MDDKLCMRCTCTDTGSNKCVLCNDDSALKGRRFKFFMLNFNYDYKFLHVVLLADM